MIVGFAAETGSLERAREKAERKGVDLLVANDVAEEGSGFGTDTNRVTIVVPGEPDEPWPMLTKAQVANRLLDRMVALRSGNRPPRVHHWQQHERHKPANAGSEVRQARSPRDRRGHRQDVCRRPANRDDHRLRLPDRADRGRGWDPDDPRRRLAGHGHARLRRDGPRDDGRDAPPREGRGARHAPLAGRCGHAVPELRRDDRGVARARRPIHQRGRRAGSQGRGRRSQRADHRDDCSRRASR